MILGHFLLVIMQIVDSHAAYSTARQSNRIAVDLCVGAHTHTHTRIHSLTRCFREHISSFSPSSLTFVFVCAFFPLVNSIVYFAMRIYMFWHWNCAEKQFDWRKAWWPKCKWIGSTPNNSIHWHQYHCW